MATRIAARGDGLNNAGYQSGATYCAARWGYVSWSFASLATLRVYLGRPCHLSHLLGHT
jgi:hypothetical protein